MSPLSPSLVTTPTTGLKAFCPKTLLSDREKYGSSELLRRLGESQQEMKQELVSLVNSNYKEFLAVSNDIKTVSGQISSLRGFLTLIAPGTAFDRVKLLLESTSLQSGKLVDEMRGISCTLSDTCELVEIVDILLNVDYALSLHRGTLHVSDLSVLVQEVLRSSAMISALDSVISETGVSSATMQEILPQIRDESQKVRTRLGLRLKEILKSSDSVDELETLCRGLLDLGMEDAMHALLRAKFFFQKVVGFSTGQNLDEYFSSVVDTFTSPSHPFQVLCDRMDNSSSLRWEVMVRFVLENLASHAEIFVPSEEAEIFYQNFQHYKQFIASTRTPIRISAPFMKKWQTSIYVRQVLGSLRGDLGGSPAEWVEKLKSHEFFFTRLLALDPLRVYRWLGEWCDGVRVGGAGGGSSPVDHVLTCMVSGHLILGLEFFALKFLKSESKLFLFKANQIIESLIAQVVPATTQILDSVKQISALYRVAGRGMPTRPSVYVELAGKPVTAFAESLGKSDENSALFSTEERAWVLHRLETQVTQMCVSHFGKMASELLARERQKGGPEVPLIEAQVSLDRAKLEEMLKSKFR